MLLPALYLVHAILFLILMAFLVFLGTEVLEARQLLLRASIFLVAAIFATAASFLGLLRSGISGRLRKIYGGVAFLFLFSMIAVQASRAVEVYPAMRRVQRVTEWFMPKLNRLAWWEGIRGPMHDFEYLIVTLVILLFLVIGFAVALWRSRGEESSEP